MASRNAVTTAALIIALIPGILLFRATASADSIKVRRISIERARQMLADPNVVIIDVRTAKSWWRSSTKIVNSVREEPASVQQWTAKYAKDQTLIFY